MPVIDPPGAHRGAQKINKRGSTLGHRLIPMIVVENDAHSVVIYHDHEKLP